MSSRINIHIDEELKNDVQEILDDLGMDMSMAVTILFKEIRRTHEYLFKPSTKFGLEEAGVVSVEFKQKVLPVNESQYSIMGVKFSSNKKYRAALYAISSNMIEGWTPAKEDVELIKKQTDETFNQYKKR